MNLIVELLKLRRRLKKTTKKILFGKPPNLSRRYLESAAPFELIVHVGAHLGQEAELYRAFGARRVVWIEGDPDTYARLVANLAEAERKTDRPVSQQTVCALVSDADDQRRSFHRFNNEGASSSVYPPTERQRREWPGLGLSGDPIELPTRTLESILDELQIHPAPTPKSLLVIDVQGHELAVLAGIGRYAHTFQFCECEISQEAIYEGAALYPDIQAKFRRMGYKLVSHGDESLPWHGDVIFERDWA